MTAHTPTHSTAHPVAPPAADRRQRFGGIAALVAAATFIFGIVLFATTMSDYTSGDPTPSESVAFLVDHQTALFVWHLVIFIVFGLAVVPLALALHARLKPKTPQLADIATVSALIWSGLMFATGMISNIGIRAVADLAETDSAQASSVWSSLDAVTNGLGGGNELVGGIWVLLVSVAALASGVLPRALNWLGAVSATAGLLTLSPGMEVFEMVFGLGLIVWFVWLGVVLVRDHDRINR